MDRRALGLSVAVFLASSVVAGGTVWHAYQRTVAQQREWLTHEVGEVPQRLAERARCLTAAVDGIASFLRGSDTVTGAEWSAYTGGVLWSGSCAGVRGAATFVAAPTRSEAGAAGADLRVAHRTVTGAAADMADDRWLQLFTALPRASLTTTTAPVLGPAVPVGPQSLALVVTAVAPPTPAASSRRWAAVLVAPRDLVAGLADTGDVTVRVQDVGAMAPLVDTITPADRQVHRSEIAVLGRTLHVTVADARHDDRSGPLVVGFVGLLGLIGTVSLTWLVHTLAASRARYAAHAARSDASLRREAAETRKLSLVARHASDLVVITDPQGRLEWANDAFLRANGYTLADVTGQVTWTLLQGADTPVEASEAIRTALTTGQGCRVETVNYTSAGEPYWVSVQVQPVHEADGALTHFVGIGRDITAERRATEALERSERQYRRVVEEVEQVMFELDREARWTFLNRAWHTLTGQEIQATLGGPFVAAFHADDRDEVEALCGAVLAGDREEFRVEVRMATRPGSTCWADLHARAVLVEGRLIGMAGTLTDITARRRVQQELERARQAAEQASAAKTVFLRSMSHEMRTPLNGVLGLMELLSSTSLDAQQARYVAVARASASHLATLIGDILDLSRLEMGGLEFERTIFDLPGLLESALDSVTTDAAQKKRLRTSLRVTPAVPTWVIADPGRLRRVLVTLLTNAVQCTEAGEVHLLGDAQVDAATRRATLRLEVHDTGTAIPPDQLERLFAPFSPDDGARLERRSGSGLGLAICKRLVDAMDGSISVTSGDTTGTTFTVIVPIEVADAATVEAHRSRDLPLRVLAVLPDEADRASVGHLLDGWHFDAAVVPAIEVAWGHLESTSGSAWRFGVVVLDHAVPGARDFSTRLQRLPEPPGIVWVTADDGGAAEVAGARHRITRPVQAAALFDAVMQAAVAAATPGEAVTTLDWSRAPRVLVAEDHAVNQMVVQEMLTTMGCEVEIVGDGGAALAAASSQPFDVVLMDCQMPVLDGLEATRRLRRAHAEGRVPFAPKVIALTAHASAEDRQACLEAGMDAYLTKPVRGTVLQRTLQRLLAGVPLAPLAPVAEGAEPSPVPQPAPAPFEAPPDAEDILDPAEVLLRCNNNPDLGARMLQLFAESLPGELEALEAAATRNDREQLGRLAHKMRGAAATLAAVRLAGAITGVELFLKYGDGGPLPELIADVRHESALFLGVVPQICRRLLEPRPPTRP